MLFDFETEITVLPALFRFPDVSLTLLLPTALYEVGAETSDVKVAGSSQSLCRECIQPLRSPLM